MGFLNGSVSVESLPDASTLLQKGISQFHHSKLRCGNDTKVYE